MSSVQEIYGITERLLNLVEKPIELEQRDDIILKITSLLEEREELLENCNAPYTEVEKSLGKQIVQWNSVVMGRFEELKSQIQRDMMQLKKTKSTNSQYVNPYQGVSTSDGMFYDKRK